MKSTLAALVLIFISFSSLNGAEPPKQGLMTKPQLEVTGIDSPTHASKRVSQILKELPSGKPFSPQLIEVVALGKNAVDPLITAFKNQKLKYDKRYFAAMAIAKMQPPVAKRTFTEGLQDKSSMIRIASLRGLAMLKDPATLPSVHKALADKALIVQVAAADVLKTMGNKESIPYLAEELHKPSSFRKGESLWIRRHIVIALGNIGADEGIPTLMQVLNEDDINLQEEAIQSLEKITQQKLDGPSTIQKKEQWLAWWDNKNKESK
jgi:HEAT repeat protein